MCQAKDSSWQATEGAVMCKSMLLICCIQLCSFHGFFPMEDKNNSMQPFVTSVFRLTYVDCRYDSYSVPICVEWSDIRKLRRTPVHFYGR